MTDSSPFRLTDPGQILATSSAYWRSFALHTAVRLDLFTVIGERAVAGAEIAEKTGGDKRGVKTLLDAMAALGLVEKRNETYRNSEVTRHFLVATSPRYIGHLIRHHANLAEGWLHLERAVRSGEAVRERSSGREGVTQEDFLRGMHTQAMAVAPRVKEIDLGGGQRLLDLGGGPGTWAIHFALANPELTAVVFDLPNTQPFAEKTIRHFDLDDRVSFLGGDFNVDALPGGFDVVWLSHILHGESPDRCRALIDKAVAALNEGGRVLIHEFILAADGTQPLFAALFSLNMLVATPGGRSYRRNEIEAMLAAANVCEVEMLDFLGPTESRILVGKKDH